MFYRQDLQTQKHSLHWVEGSLIPYYLLRTSWRQLHWHGQLLMDLCRVFSRFAVCQRGLLNNVKVGQSRSSCKHERTRPVSTVLSPSADLGTHTFCVYSEPPVDPLSILDSRCVWLKHPETHTCALIISPGP